MSREHVPLITVLGVTVAIALMVYAEVVGRLEGEVTVSGPYEAGLLGAALVVVIIFSILRGGHLR